MKVMRLTVGRGRTSRPSDAEEWTKEYYEVEAAVEDPAELEVAKAELKGIIDGWLSSTPTTAKPATKPPAQLPGSEDLGKLPFRSYKTKEAAGENEAGWIFANTKGAEALLAVLKTKDKTQIAKFEYQLQGKDRQFISRKPIKEK